MVTKDLTFPEGLANGRPWAAIQGWPNEGRKKRKAGTGRTRWLRHSRSFFRWLGEWASMARV